MFISLSYFGVYICIIALNNSTNTSITFIIIYYYVIVLHYYISILSYYYTNILLVYAYIAMLFLFHYYCIIIMHAATAQQPLREQLHLQRPGYLGDERRRAHPCM